MELLKSLKHLLYLVKPRHFLSNVIYFYLPVDGGFTDWAAWGTCSVTCGGGTQTRTRDCTNPVPAHGGAYCVGDITDTQACDGGPCPGTYVLL